MPKHPLDFLTLGEIPSGLNATGLSDRELFHGKTDTGEPYLIVGPPQQDLLLPVQVSWPEFSGSYKPLKFTMLQRCGGMQIRQNPLIRIISEPSRPTRPCVARLLADGWVWTSRGFARDEQPVERWTDRSIVSIEQDAGPYLDGAPVFVRVGPRDDPRIGQFRFDAGDGNAVLVPDTFARAYFELSDGSRRGQVARKVTRSPGPHASTLSTSRVLSGRYDARLPTNRKRKRERAKARRRALQRTALTFKPSFSYSADASGLKRADAALERLQEATDG